MTEYENDINHIINPDVKSGGIVFKLLFTLACVMVIAFFTMSQIFAWERVRAVREDLNELQELSFTTRSKSNCLALYRNDVSVALGIALAANNALWVSVATRPFSEDTPEQQRREAEANARLGEQLNKSNAPLITAVKALEEYDRMNPPPDECPHPDAQEEIRTFLEPG